MLLFDRAKLEEADSEKLSSERLSRLLEDFCELFDTICPVISQYFFYQHE